MSLKPLPTNFEEARTWTWADYEPHAKVLLDATLSEETIDPWLDTWSQLRAIMDEVRSRLRIRAWRDTENQDYQTALNKFIQDISTQWQSADAELRRMWVKSGLVTEGTAFTFNKMRNALALFTEKNTALLAEEQALVGRYHVITGAQTAIWEGEEVTMGVLDALRTYPDRSRRERAFRLAAQRTLQDREALNELWLKLLNLRQQIAANAGVEDYRAYKWKELGRVDYQPQDALQFCKAIEQVVVPAFARFRERLRQSRGYDPLRPCDVANSVLEVSPDPLGRPNIHSFDSIEDYQNKAETIFRKVKATLAIISVRCAAKTCLIWMTVKEKYG